MTGKWSRVTLHFDPNGLLHAEGHRLASYEGAWSCERCGLATLRLDTLRRCKGRATTTASERAVVGERGAR